MTIIVVAQHGMIASGGVGSDVDISYPADTVLLFRYFEACAEVRQAVSVFKKRTGPHERSIRQLVVDERGVHIGEPLSQFRGIMSGIPQYQDATVGHSDARDPQPSLRAGPE